MIAVPHYPGGSPLPLPRPPLIGREHELGAWHVIVLNSNCGPAGGCGRGSPQQRWLETDLAGTSLPVSTPIGYVFEQDGHAVGAVELNGRPALVVEPGASPELHRTLTLAALALGVFWDPANTDI